MVDPQVATTLVDSKRMQVLHVMTSLADCIHLATTSGRIEKGGVPFFYQKSKRYSAILYDVVLIRE